MSHFIRYLSRVITDLKSGQMDFEGQDLAAKAMTQGMLLTAVLSIIIGTIFQSYAVMIQSVAVLTTIVGLFTVPSWPVYRRNVLVWQAVRKNSSDDEGGDEQDLIGESDK